MVAGMLKTAVMISMDVQRARSFEKQATRIIQQLARVPKRHTRYQANSVQSIGRWVILDVQARIGLKIDRCPCARKNSGAKGYKFGCRSFFAAGT